MREEISNKIKAGNFNYADYFPDSPRASNGATKTIKQIGETWLKSGGLAKSTREGYEKSLRRYWYPKVGHMEPKEVTSLVLMEALSDFTGCAKTRNNTIIPIRKIFAVAMADRLTTTNPALEIHYVKHQTPDPDPFDPEEVKAILQWILEHYGEEVENYFGVGFYAGLRTSEEMSIVWNDIDWNDDIIKIQRARVRKEHKGTKTGLSRDHELNSVALYYLSRQKKFTQLKGDLVFPDPVTGRQFNDDKPPRLRYWIPALKALGIRYREPYQMRHTYATRAIMAGVNPVYVARQMGNSVRVMFKNYARWIERADRGRERSKLEDALGQNPGQTMVKEGKKRVVKVRK